MKEHESAVSLKEESRIFVAEGQELKVEYRLLLGPNPSQELPFYGVEVRNADTGERFYCDDLTVDFASVLALFEEMCRGAVTPVTAGDVVSDWLSERDTVKR
ncbi:MAG: hypothetical protein IJL39_05065 [Clostridia bacterium]|nr:hypothetical protein [Clostridia bacterium]